MAKNTFNAQILTPEGKRFEGEVIGVQVPGLDGRFEMKVNHAPIIATLDIGHVRIQKADAGILFFAVSRGFVEMNNNRLTLMGQAVERVDVIDVERAQRAKERALQRIEKKEEDMDVMVEALKRAENRLKLIQNPGGPATG